MEEEGQRINNTRAAQAIEVKADVIAVGCPFCLTMMSDGIKALDIAEIVWKSMDLEEEPEPVEVCAAPAE